MVRGKTVLPKLHPNPTRVWDTFAEPNNLNNTECSLHTKSGLIPEFSGPSPKKQVNRGRLRMEAAQNLSYGVQKHLTKSGGLFFPFTTTSMFQFRWEPQYLQWIASASWPSLRQFGQTCVVIRSLFFCETISADTIPVGTAIIP
jgi:hypothetical protein